MESAGSYFVSIKVFIDEADSRNPAIILKQSRRPYCLRGCTQELDMNTVIAKHLARSQRRPATIPTPKFDLAQRYIDLTRLRRSVQLAEQRFPHITSSVNSQHMAPDPQAPTHK